MKVDIKITGGTVVDPWRGLNGPGEVYLQGSRIVAREQGEPLDAARTINAAGCIVLPGLIDFHAHLCDAGTELGVPPDSSLLPLGITTAVDAGSCGVANYRSFAQTMAASKVRIFSLLNVCPAGLVTSRYHEQYDPKYFDEPAISELFGHYGGQLLGLKIRQSKDIVGDLGIKPLQATVQIAQRLGCPVTVHTTNPPVAAEELAAVLRPGDVFCHVHHGTGETILGKDGKVKQTIIDAQKAGIVFDAANGRNNFSFAVAKAALDQGFYPDVISSDVTAKTVYGEYVFGLPYIMMKYLALGMEIGQVVAACTSVPAKLLGMEGKIGTLAPGAAADVAIFRLAGKPLTMRDNFGQTISGNNTLVPQMTIRDGKVAYCQIDF